MSKLFFCSSRPRRPKTPGVRLNEGRAHRGHGQPTSAVQPPHRAPRRPWLGSVPRSIAALCVLSAVVACSPAEIVGHRAVVAAPTTYPAEGALRHSGRLWIELRESTPDTQCVQAAERQPLCFQEIRAATAGQLLRALTPSFADVRVRQRGDALLPGDYLLRLQLKLNVVAPATEPGWGAVARGSWQLVRDGFNVASERVHSRSRQDFVYGAALGQGAGEVVAAITSHVGERVGRLPEARPMFPAPDLPQVITEPAATPQLGQAASALR